MSISDRIGYYMLDIPICSYDKIKPDLTTEHSIMKKIAILISRGVTNVIMLGIGSTGIVLASAPARAANSSSGNLNSVNGIPSFLFFTDGISIVNI